eukprot:361614-Chlamydomonas_euryale.AAC.6
MTVACAYLCTCRTAIRKLQVASFLPEGYSWSYLSVKVLAVDCMWRPTAKVRVNVVNKKDTNRSISIVYDGTKDSTTSACKLVGTYFGTTLENDAVMELANLKEPESGWLIDDTLELHCTVMSEDAPKFSLETANVTPDLWLALPCGAKLPTHWSSMRLASDVLCRCAGNESMLVSYAAIR